MHAYQTMKIPALIVRMNCTSLHQPFIRDPLTIKILSLMVRVQWYQTRRKCRIASIALRTERNVRQQFVRCN